MEVFSLRPIRSTADWIDTVGKKNYKQGSYSAYQVSQSWRNLNGRLPAPMSKIFESSKDPLFHNLKPEHIVAEKQIYLLDSLKNPSRTDIMSYCSNSMGETILLCVECKAKETFASRVSSWVATPDEPPIRRQALLFHQKAELVPRKLNRLKSLNTVLGTNVMPDSHLRYQLLHRTASAIIEGRNLSARAAVMVVQAFTASVENFFDFSDFCDTLGLSCPRKDTVLGPYFTPFNESTPLYLLYVQDSLSSEKSPASLF